MSPQANASKMEMATFQKRW